MTLQEIKGQLINLEQRLAELVMEEQDKAEADPEFQSHFRRDDGTFICPPEDAAPELDCARSYIQDAIGSIIDWEATQNG